MIDKSPYYLKLASYLYFSYGGVVVLALPLVFLLQQEQLQKMQHVVTLTTSPAALAAGMAMLALLLIGYGAWIYNLAKHRRHSLWIVSGGALVTFLLLVTCLLMFTINISMLLAAYLPPLLLVILAAESFY